VTPHAWNNMEQHWYEAYERGRPGYPRDVVAAPGLPRAARVLELAAGTGKLTRLLVSNVGRVVAVEPDDEMRHRLLANCPDANTLAGIAEHIPLASDSVDGVFAAQCAHLFDRDRAFADIARVLRPGGALALLWNVQVGQPEPSIAPVEQLLGRHWPEGWDPLDLGDPIPNAREDWQTEFGRSGFEPFHQVALPNPQTVDPGGLVAFMHSMGWIATLPDDERISLLERVKGLLTSNRYMLPWETRLYWARLREPVA
jgi:SAM-dependent methyltransferase